MTAGHPHTRRRTFPGRLGSRRAAGVRGCGARGGRRPGRRVLGDAHHCAVSLGVESGPGGVRACHQPLRGVGYGADHRHRRCGSGARAGGAHAGSVVVGTLQLRGPRGGESREGAVGRTGRWRGGLAAAARERARRRGAFVCAHRGRLRDRDARDGAGAGAPPPRAVLQSGEQRIAGEPAAARQPDRGRGRGQHRGARRRRRAGAGGRGAPDARSGRVARR